MRFRRQSHRFRPSQSSRFNLLRFVRIQRQNHRYQPQQSFRFKVPTSGTIAPQTNTRCSAREQPSGFFFTHRQTKTPPSRLMMHKAHNVRQARRENCLFVHSCSSSSAVISPPKEGAIICARKKNIYGNGTRKPPPLPARGYPADRLSCIGRPGKRRQTYATIHLPSLSKSTTFFLRARPRTCLQISA